MMVRGARPALVAPMGPCRGGSHAGRSAGAAAPEDYSCRAAGGILCRRLKYATGSGATFPSPEHTPAPLGSTFMTDVMDMAAECEPRHVGQ